MTDYQLRPISPDGVPEALIMAHRYRLLNEPRAAESICRDVLVIDADNQQALVTLLLALTDQFGMSASVSIQDVQTVVPQLTSEYEREYYQGIIYERWAKSQLESQVPGYVVYELLCRAMACYDRAAPISPDNNDDATLRYNTCVRMIQRYSALKPRPEEHSHVGNYGDSSPL